ncbi:hypothetical protein J1N35_018795, partial [Gossypium stocksii]
MDAFSSFSILFLSTIFQLSYAHDDDIHFTSCAPFDCGNLPNISYPFWTDQYNRPSYCGYGDEGYKLKCMQNEPPVMTLGSQDFQVLHLNQSRDLLTIKRVELNSTCPQQILITNLFNYSETAENITLFYDCRSRGGSNHSFSCRKGGREMFPVLFKEDENDCDGSSEKVEIPVGKKAFDDLMSGTSAVTEKFNRNYIANYAGILAEDADLTKVYPQHYSAIVVIVLIDLNANMLMAERNQYMLEEWRFGFNVVYDFPAIFCERCDNLVEKCSNLMNSSRYPACKPVEGARSLNTALNRVKKGQFTHRRPLFMVLVQRLEIGLLKVGQVKIEARVLIP